jgi:hypothetical protein
MSQIKVEKNLRQLPIEAAENLVLLDDRKDALDDNLKLRLSLIRCNCGAEILLLPDLGAMSRAIKTHVFEHTRRERSAEMNRNDSNNIDVLLSQRVIRKIIG